MIPLPDKKYSIIYADPPWGYKTGHSKKWKGIAERHYQTMTVDEIAALPIPDITEKDAILFMWVTFPCLSEGLKIIEAWGFTYKTVAFNWVKQNKGGSGIFWGLGFWTRSNSEACLLAVKGRPKRISASVHSVVMSPVQQHSRKPAEVRDRIVELMGDLPRIELFARETAPGWDAWGNEVPAEDLREEETDGQNNPRDQTPEL